MEDAFDFDFASVRVHEGEQASAAGADAYAQGTDLHFAPGQYDPGSSRGQELIGHELAHVVQQGEGRVATTTQYKGLEINDDVGLEAEADHWGAIAARGEAVARTGGTSGGSSAVQRQVVQRGGDTKAAKGDDLQPDELVLTRDPAHAKESFLAWFRKEVKAKVESWGLGFDDHAVRLARAGNAHVIALRWSPMWGTQPSTTDVPLSMNPIDAEASVAAVRKLKGWGRLDGGDQVILCNLLGGETNRTSEAARDHLRSIFSRVRACPEDEQGKVLKGLIGSKDTAPSVADEQVETVISRFDLEGPVVKKDYEFRGRTADAESWQAKFKDGVAIEIVAPKAPEAGHHQHSVREAADAASYLPRATRAVVHLILLNVVENPEDAHWAVEYNEPGFHSYMTANPTGRVTIYPNAKSAQPGANYLRGTMIHETGHTWSYKTWGTDNTKGKWLEWKAAMEKDRVSLSDYAMNSIAEDVAETIQVFVSTRGAPKFQEYEAMVPARFAMLAAEYK